MNLKPSLFDGLSCQNLLFVNYKILVNGNSICCHMLNFYGCLFYIYKIDNMLINIVFFYGCLVI